MKTTINNAAFKKSNSKIGEIFLFREMAKSLNNYVPAVYVHETHGRRGWVKFYSQKTQGNRQREISDLLIICVNRPSNEIKVSFLQAKYHKTKTIPFLVFYGDYLQLELLADRPNIDPYSFYNFPSNILNFSNYRSLTNFGVFFHDKNGEIDMLYSVADLLKQNNSNGLKGPIRFPGQQQCPNINCYTDTSRELISTCNIDLFEKGLINFQIGAPINNNRPILLYFKVLFKQVLTQRNLGVDNDVLNLILGDKLDNLDSFENTDSEIGGHPSMLIIQTNRETFKE